MLFNVRGLLNHHKESLPEENKVAVQTAISLISSHIEGIVPDEEAAYNEAAKETIPPMPMGAIGRWWFNKGYQHSDRLLLGTWREGVIDELVVLGIYKKEHDLKPKLALQDMICYNIDIALDPQVSSSAQALIDQGYKKGLEAGIQAGRDAAAREALMR